MASWSWAMVLVVGLVIYGIVGQVTHRRILMKHVEPLSADAPSDRFSEGRAMQHLYRLAQDIGIRQEGSAGLEQAAVYIRDQVLQLATHASSNVSIEVDDSFVSGSFNMIFLRHSIALAYRNHRNILVRIASAYAKNDDAAVLINGHFDSPLGSPGAGDCGSCIASMLEASRLIIDSGWVPPHPIIFLFNGAEELFLLASHGFMSTHKWRDTVGAFINLEAAGTGGLDLVCQSGPEAWPSWVYAKSAVYPMAHSAAQDIFPVIPGDTDYRIFAEDYGDIPGLDIIFLIGGYFYHTSYDRIENILPGSIQARGENLLSVLKALANSPELQNAQQRAEKTFAANSTLANRPIFFDYLSWFMVIYSKETSMILHLLPMVIVVIALLLPMSSKFSNLSRLTRLWYIIKGMALHAAGLVLAVIVPAVLAFLRLLVSNSAMVWYAHPSLALFMFVPGALLGLLLPKFYWGLSLANDLSDISKNSNEFLKKEQEAVDWMSHWGSVAFYSSLTVVYLYAGLGGGFLTFWWAAFLILSWPMFCFCVQIFGRQSVKSLWGYAIPLIVPIAFSLYFGGVFLQFLIEKMGMFGSVPQPYGYFVSDIMIACVTGVVVGWCIGPLITIAGSWLAQSVPMQFLLHFSVVAMALSSQFFPYSVDAPKRVVLQHTFRTTGGNAILYTSYDLAVLDANGFGFLFKNVPEVVEELSMGSKLNKVSANYSNEGVWMALYPISELFTSRSSYPSAGEDIFVHYPSLPHLFMTEDIKLSSSQFRRVHLELDLGSLQEVWVAVLNITGPLSSWSFSENQLPVPEQVNGGPPSYILRLSGSSSENWKFWLEANSSEALNIDLAVLDQYLDKQTIKLKGRFPSWADVTVYSCFLSSYAF